MNDKFSGSRRINRFIDGFSASHLCRCASCARTILSLSLSFSCILSMFLFYTQYVHLRVNREFHRASTIDPNLTPTIFLLFLVCIFYVCDTSLKYTRTPTSSLDYFCTFSSTRESKFLDKQTRAREGCV